MVIAIGGNALVGGSRTFESQLSAISNATGIIAELVMKGNRIVVTHGNGPQVGDTLLRHEAAKRTIQPLPLYACVAETQGLLGFMIQSSLSAQLGNDDVISLVSISYVSENDAAFLKPTKPIGPLYNKDGLRAVRRVVLNSVFEKTTADKYRRLVASPDPISVTGTKAVRDLLERGFVVVTAGGGGIPAIKIGRKTVFVDAVVDKDLASERLATDIGATKFVILTDVEGVYLNYTGKRKLLREVTASEMKRYLKKGEFPEGSMAPKVRAAVRFADNTGNSTIICKLDKMNEALAGNAGTVILKQ